MWKLTRFWHTIVGPRRAALRKALSDAVEREDYTKAARLRDEIRCLERRLDESDQAVPERQASR